MEPSKFNISPSKTEVKFYDEICLCKQINSTIKECLGIKKIYNFLLKQVNVKKLSTREITYFNNEYKKLKNKK